MRKNLTNLIANKCRNNTPTYPLNIPADIDANWVRCKSNLAYLKLDIKVPYVQIQQEVNNIKDLFVTHREDYNEHEGWYSFSIHGKSYDSTREDEYYNDQRPFVWTNEAEALMPLTVDFFKNNWFGNTFARLRVMKLAPGGYIFLHSDEDKNKTNNCMYPVNIAITQPKECEFIFENAGVVPFEPGSAFLLNVSNKHLVINNSNEDRYHLIAHHLTTTREYNKIIVNSFNRYINETGTINN